jgi:translation initiation factor eIF-2B subunit gamma
MSTRLQDAHIYVMRRTFLDLLASRRAKDLDSLREQVIPWLIKTAWQKGLSQRYSPSELYMPPGRETN